MGSQRECTRILGLASFRVETVEWEADGSRARIRVWIERRGIRGYECSGCRQRTWRVRDHAERTWEDLPWAEHRVTLVYRQRRVYCRMCGIRTERVAFADPKAPYHQAVATGDWTRLSIDADVARSGATRRQLEQSAARGAGVSRRVGLHQTEAPATTPRGGRDPSG